MENDKKDLINMINDQKTKCSLYKPGVYWKKNCDRIINEMLKEGVKGFRGKTSNVGQSYTDKCTFEVEIISRGSNSLKLNLLRFINTVPLLRGFYKLQLQNSEKFFNEIMFWKNLYFEINENKIINSFGYLEIPQSTLIGDCQDYIYVKSQDRKVSVFYLQVLSRIAKIAKYVDLNNIYSYMELGGGFGATLHAIKENFENIRKFYYVDLPPNLHTGIQYLKSVIGDGVRNYSDNRFNKNIKFKDDNSLEVICLAPWQLELIESNTIDFFHNSCSFVEMDDEQIKNYSKEITRILKNKSTISLIGYADKSSVHKFDSLKKYFEDRDFLEFESQIPLPNPSNKYSSESHLICLN